MLDRFAADTASYCHIMLLTASSVGDGDVEKPGVPERCRKCEAGAAPRISSDFCSSSAVVIQLTFSCYIRISKISYQCLANGQ